MNEPKFTIKTESNENGFGRFFIEPLEQGYGQTMGNSLRRVLLSSLPGAAIFSVKIENVRHQFSTITGLKEDVVELILNLKKVKLTIEGDEVVELKLSKKGKGAVTAADIEAPAGTKIVNPDHIIGTLTEKNSNLEMTIRARNGFGYETAAEAVTDEVGVIPVDALYSPVYRVNYRIDQTRVGRMTNLDKLVLEIWTDGSIDPKQAMDKAAQILVSYFKQIFDPVVVDVKKEEVQMPAVSEEILKTRIEELDIPTRIVNALGNGGIETIEKLLETPRPELMKIKNLGGKSISIVEAKLSEKGVKLL